MVEQVPSLGQIALLGPEPEVLVEVGHPLHALGVIRGAMIDDHGRGNDGQGVVRLEHDPKPCRELVNASGQLVREDVDLHPWLLWKLGVRGDIHLAAILGHCWGRHERQKSESGHLFSPRWA